MNKLAKQNIRVDRDEDMEFFILYYKEKCNMIKFSNFRREKNHPERIK